MCPRLRKQRLIALKCTRPTLTYPYSMRLLLVSANRERLPSRVLPVGLLTVASAARARHEVSLVDLCFEPEVEPALADAIDRFRPDVVGLGLRNLHTNNYDGTEQLLAGYEAIGKTVRELTAAPIVLGGSGFSLRPAAILERLGAQHGVVGEGELALPRLLDALAEGRAAPSLLIEGPRDPALARLARRQPEGAARYALDHVPLPAFDLADRRYFFEGDGTVSVQTKRGCAFACSYCDYPDLEGNMIRLRDPNAVADEVEGWLRVPGVRSLFFVDSVFNVPKWHALAVCRALIERDLRLPWLCYASPAGLDEELVAAMSRAGCVGVEIGSDTGTEESLRRLRKPFDLAAIRRAHQLFATYGIRDCHTFVVGAEHEDVCETERTLRFVEELDPDVAVFVVFHEDRETHGVGQAAHGAALRELLARQAPTHPGWVVPELGIRFGDKVTRLLERKGVRGSSWLHLAQLRRGGLRAMRSE